LAKENLFTISFFPGKIPRSYLDNEEAADKQNRKN